MNEKKAFRIAHRWKETIVQTLNSVFQVTKEQKLLMEMPILIKFI